MSKSFHIVDDNDGILEILKSYVAKEGYTPLIAHDGEEALEMFWAYSPVLLLLDIMMPIKDGFEVCREIRKTSNIPNYYDYCQGRGR